MSVGSYSITYYRCICDFCKVERDVRRDYKKIYNGAQAVRSIGWSFGKDGTVLCDNCRLTHTTDRYR